MDETIFADASTRWAHRPTSHSCPRVRAAAYAVRRDLRQDDPVSSLRSDPRTSAALRGSGWTSNSPQAEELLTRLAPAERVDLLFTTLRFHGALTAGRLLLWRGTFKIEHMELRRPLTALRGGSPSRFVGAVVLDGPEGAIELKPLTTAATRVLDEACRSVGGDTPSVPPRVAQDNGDAAWMPGAHRSAAGRTPSPPRAETGTGPRETAYRVRTIRTWQDAELAAVDHMLGLGFTDARVTGASADGGIDVIARDAVAQVKHYSQPIGVGPVRELRGVADAHQHLLFYASGGYTAAARQFADDRGVALFSLQETGHITVLNEAATRLSTRPAPAPAWNRAAAWSGQAVNLRVSQRVAELEAQRQTVLRLIARVRAHTSELHALPSNRYTKDRIKALKAAHQLTARAEVLLRKSQAEYQTHGGRKRLIALADEKAREAALKLGIRA
ncbi:restriction endonuclease [Streptomyces coelicoflavus]|uniref:restriction endonuclease n=1 Tax=Streptomyces coelicoflavus TaxID=285562 RepID=UPI00131F1D94|nr:restriction endonuclease [Streptomyces coelicoflavus]